MTVTSKSVNMLAVTDTVIVAVASMLCFLLANAPLATKGISVAIFVLIVMLTLNLKGFYDTENFGFKKIYVLLEGLFISTFVSLNNPP